MKQIQRTNLFDWKIFCLFAVSAFLVTGIDAAHQKQIAASNMQSQLEYASLIDPIDQTHKHKPEEKNNYPVLPDPSL